MLKITPYLGIIVLIVSIGGLYYPILGYFLLLVFASLMLISPFYGRWFCGNLCPRGSFNDFWLGKLTQKKKIPKFFRSMWVRIPIFILLMGFMVVRIISTKGMINKIGMVFVVMCLVTTSISIILGILISPRAWCTFCPMGTLQNFFGKEKYKLICDLKRCTKCGICERVCPMQLPVRTITHSPDCIKCSRCVKACPVDALSFQIISK